MNIRLHQLNPVIGDLEGNKKKILGAIEQAEQDNLDLLLLPELCVTGYPPLDLLEKEAFRELCYQVNADIIEATGKCTVIFGSVTRNQGKTGRKAFNSAIIAGQGKEFYRVHKALLPTYDVFDDLRYFEPGSTFEPVNINGVSVGVTVCEDIWYNDNEIQYHIYDVNPAEELVKAGAEIIVNISASPFNRNKPVSRKNMLQNHSRNLEVPLLYVNQTGAHTELLFDGDSMAFDHHGDMIVRSKRFTEDHLNLKYEAHRLSADPETSHSSMLGEPAPEAAVFEALKMGIREYLEKTGAAETVILGLSGGIDSALVCTLAKEALGADKVKAVTMPSEFSSEGSVSDSELLARNLGVELTELPIKNIFDAYLNTLEPVFEGTAFNVAEENLQSRSRGDLLMAIANKFGYMLLNTGNKSEMAVGYCTLYGDMAGGLSPISDLYKTEVYELCRWLNDRYYGKEIIPEAILTKEPSAELRPDQKDSDSLPDYEDLDSILKAYLEDQKSREEIIAMGYNEQLTDRVMRFVDLSEHKRYQAPPGLKVSAKAFGMGRRWPLAQKWTGQEAKFRIGDKEYS